MHPAARIRSVAVSALASTFSPLSAHAAVVVWQAPEECPTEIQIRERVTELLGKPPEAFQAAPDVTARIEQHETRWELVVTTAEGGRERRMQTERCDDLALPAAVAIALTIDPSAVGGDATDAPAPAERASEPAPARPEPAPAPPPPVADDGADVPAADVRPKEREKDVTEWLVGARGVVDTAALPSLAPGVAIHGGVSAGILRVELSGTYLFAQEHQISDVDVGGSFSLISGSAGACVRFIDASARVYGCGGLELGSMRATGVGVPNAIDGNGRWVAPWVGPGIVVPFGNVSLLLGADARFPLVGERFTITVPQGLNEESHLVHEVGRPSLRAGAGLEIRAL